MALRIMTGADIPAGVRLNQIAGWNQTASDWQRLLEASPEGCFVEERDGQVRGTVTTISYEDRFAWIGMVLVDPQYRGRGMGNALLNNAVRYLDMRNIATLKLDATPQGKPLYEKLGFVTEYEIERWTLNRWPAQAGQENASCPGVGSCSELKSILESDRSVFGASRGCLLESLHRSAPKFTLATWDNGALTGYLFGRPGLFADHLGPWMAKDAMSARSLLETFLSRSPRETVVVDRLKANHVANRWLRFFGFTYSRSLTRMYRGTNEYPGCPDLMCAILGPEFG